VFRSTRTRALSGLATAALLGILVVAPGAYGQAAVDQYVPALGPPGTSSEPPAGESQPSGSGLSESGEGKAAVVAKPASDGSSGGVEIPVSDGYPVPPFVVLVALLLACGIAARLIMAGMRRKEDPA